MVIGCRGIEEKRYTLNRCRGKCMGGRGGMYRDRRDSRKVRREMIRTVWKERRMKRRRRPCM
jgi:hypothetical protein